MKVIGMISGTSFDAIEAIAAELEFDGDTLIADLREHTSTPYPEDVREAIAAMMPPAATTLEQVCKLDAEIGRCFADAAQTLAESAFDGAAEVVASHGQTVFHWVEGSHAVSTLQIGQPAFIAERTAPRSCTTCALGISSPAARARRWRACSTCCCLGTTSTTCAAP